MLTVVAAVAALVSWAAVAGRWYPSTWDPTVVFGTAIFSSVSTIAFLVGTISIYNTVLTISDNTISSRRWLRAEVTASLSDINLLRHRMAGSGEHTQSLLEFFTSLDTTSRPPVLIVEPLFSRRDLVRLRTLLEKAGVTIDPSVDQHVALRSGPP
jgi:hypothetical protein